MLTIAIDPGHPSNFGDTGSQSVCGRLVECRYTYAIARQLERAIVACGGPMRPLLLRTAEDEVVSVADRASRATDVGADIVVSIHVDSWQEPTYRGAHILYWPGNEDGRKVATQMASSWPPVLGRYREGVAAHEHQWPRPRNVLGAYAETAILAECGYASNPQDVDALLEPSVQSQIVGALMQGLRLYRQLREAHWLGV